jgi:hypothetical protein
MKGIRYTDTDIETRLRRLIERDRNRPWQPRTYLVSPAMYKQMQAMGMVPPEPGEFNCDESLCGCASCLEAALSRPTIPEIPLAPAVPSFWVPTPPEPEPEPELTPIPQIRRRRCYRCGAPNAIARAKDEPAYCEEHRSKR